MAELHGNGWSKNRGNNNAMAPMGSWPRSKADESEARHPIELHGAAYIAFCKAWAPLWIEPEDASDED